MSTDAHHNEYLAAISGMSEHTISPRPSKLEGHAIGDQISFRLRSWGDTGCMSGRVADFNESRGTLLVETEDDIIEVDAREVGNGGEVLPF